MPTANKPAKKFLELHETLIFLPTQLLFRPTGVFTGCAVCVQTHHHVGTDKKISVQNTWCFVSHFSSYICK
jgi:hypothetical protein